MDGGEERDFDRRCSGENKEIGNVGLSLCQGLGAVWQKGGNESTVGGAGKAKEFLYGVGIFRRAQ